MCVVCIDMLCSICKHTMYIYVQWMVFCFCRHYKDNVRVMKEPCNVGDVLACPACPRVCSCIIEHACIFVTNKVNILLIQEKGIITLSIDANFGLCCKKTAGSSVREPLSGTSMFCHQGDVNDYVLNNVLSSVTADVEKVLIQLPITNSQLCVVDMSVIFLLQDCSDFLAGNALRSHGRFSALDETAMMGVVCRHEYPLCFINLYHGEKFSIHT